MAKTITVQISDSDYDDLVQHLASEAPGRLLVAVCADMSAPGSFLKQDLEARKHELRKAAIDAKAVRR